MAAAAAPAVTVALREPSRGGPPAAIIKASTVTAQAVRLDSESESATRARLTGSETFKLRLVDFFFQGH